MFLVCKNVGSMQTYDVVLPESAAGQPRSLCSSLGLSHDTAQLKLLFFFSRVKRRQLQRWQKSEPSYPAPWEIICSTGV